VNPPASEPGSGGLNPPEIKSCTKCTGTQSSNSTFEAAWLNSPVEKTAHWPLHAAENPFDIDWIDDFTGTIVWMRLTKNPMIRSGIVQENEFVANRLRVQSAAAQGARSHSAGEDTGGTG